MVGQSTPVVRVIPRLEWRYSKADVRVRVLGGFSSESLSSAVLALWVQGMLAVGDGLTDSNRLHAGRESAP